MPKCAIRSRTLEQRRVLPPDRYRLLSDASQRQLLSTPEVAEAKVVGLYSPVHGEVDTGLLARDLTAGRRQLVYPRVAGDDLEFIKILPGEKLVPGSFGVLEPEGQVRVPLVEIDLIVVPGAAFDRKGHRLGYGKGYYDRALRDEETRPVLAGLAFSFQVVDRLPAQAHDVQLQFLATDTGLVRISGRGAGGEFL